MSAPTTLNSFVSGSSAPSLSEGSQQVPMEDESLHALLSDLLDEHLKPNVDYSVSQAKITGDWLSTDPR